MCFEYFSDKPAALKLAEVYHSHCFKKIVTKVHHVHAAKEDDPAKPYLTYQ